MELLAETAHRPWALPAGPWIMRQTWSELLFAHWPVEPAALASRLPAGLELQTHGGSAWIGVVPFRMSGVRLRGLPPLLGTGAFPELNVRTYVTRDERPGVLFFSLDAASAVAVAVARAWFRLPYYRARMTCAVDGSGADARVTYASRRTHRGAPPAELEAEYGPIGPVVRSRPGSVEHFLTERYCLYSVAADGSLRRGEIHHAPWPLQPARATWTRCTMTAPLGLEPRPDDALLHFVRRLDVVVWPPRRA